MVMEMCFKQTDSTYIHYGSSRGEREGESLVDHTPTPSNSNSWPRYVYGLIACTHTMPKMSTLYVRYPSHAHVNRDCFLLPLLFTCEALYLK